MRLLVIDGNSIANRAYFGIRELTTKDGRHTNAVYGFLATLLSLLKECSPDEVAVAFDVHAPTFRHKMYADYKGTRHAMDEELVEQMPVIKELLGLLGFRTVECEGWEADDILGTLAAACGSRGDLCFLATGDRDSLQLVTDTTTVLLASTVMGKSRTVVMDPAAVREKYGVEPIELIQVKSLMGDTSDNIPGVKGIGEKTALTLVREFKTLEGVYENINSPVIKPKQREKLLADKENAELSRVLGTIRTDAPVPSEAGAYARTAGDPAAAVRMLRSLEIYSMISRFGLEGVEPAAEAEAEKTEEKPLPAAEASPLPEAPKGTYLLAARPPRVEKQGSRNVVTAPEQWYAVQDTNVHPLDEAALLRLLNCPDVRLEVFDSAPLYALALRSGFRAESIVWDGKLAAYLLDASANKYLVEKLAGEYNAAAAFTFEEWPDAGRLASLFAALKAGVTACGEDELYSEIEFPLASVLAEMTHTGILVDRAGIEAFGAEVSAMAAEVEKRIYLEAGFEFNINSPKQLGEALFEKLGMPHGKKTSLGWATDADTLEALCADYPICADILEYRTYRKLVSTYVDGLLKVIAEDGRIHSTFNQTEARTGRLSSDNPNLQNIPIRTELGSRMRAFFTAKPGCVFVDADYSQIELRILAHISGDANMQEAFQSGADIHRSTAARIYGMPIEKVTPRLRSSAKAVNFGIMYGKGAFSLSRDLNVSVREAEDFLKSYLAAYPNIDVYMKKTIEDAKSLGYVSTLFGRRRALPELSSKNFQVRSGGERMARNTPIQGTAADVIKLAMVRVSRRLRAENMESRLILTVHDELIVEAPEAEAQKAAALLREEMENCVHYAVPLTAEAGIGKTWLEAH